MKKAMAFILIMLLIGCSTFKPSTQPVKFSCNPEDVTLVINGQKKECPTTVDLPRNREMSIEGHKEGYLPYQRTISYHKSDTYWLDVIGTCICLVPVIGLMSPGAHDLDETDISVILTKK
jgi:hypothetical protein